jgi:S-adenosylmethionine-diacylglycerol 3-amino-3-carboxypropyl transferase
LQLRPDDALFCITSGGCNALGLLLQDPRVIYAVDINPSQSHLLELKRAAIRRLPFARFQEFLGLHVSSERKEMFEAIAEELSPEAAYYWRLREDVIRDGVLGQGRYEKFLRLFRRGLRLLQGRRRIESFFRCRTLAEQREFHDRVWDTRRWRLLFKLLFNKRMLARRGLSPDYFRFDDGSASFSESFYRRAKRAFRDIPIRENYFLAQYLLGRYLELESVPDYLKEENFETIRGRVDRIQIVTADAKVWLALQEPGSIDAFSLSNICELMSLDDTVVTFEQVVRTARPNARICFRNLMIPRSVPEHLRDRIHCDAEMSRKLLMDDRSVVYSRVDAYWIT